MREIIKLTVLCELYINPTVSSNNYNVKIKKKLVLVFHQTPLT